MESHVFTVADAKDGLATITDSKAQVVVCSPPYFRCRDYSPTTAHANHIGESVRTNDSAQLGHEATPQAYVERLAECFGTGEYLANDGSLWVVIGDTFARGREAGFAKGEAIGIQHLLVAAMRSRGWLLWQEIIWAKPSAPPSGAVKVRCNPSHEYVLWFVRHKPYFSSSAIRETGHTSAGTVMPPVGGKKYGDYKKTIVSDGMRCRQDVWIICGSRDKTAHVAPFPSEIPRLIIEACSKPGDLVVDPFAGTRTTATVAKSLGRSSICFDIFDHHARHEPAKKRAKTTHATELNMDRCTEVKLEKSNADAEE